MVESYTDEIDLIRKVDKLLKIGVKPGPAARTFGISYNRLMELLEGHSVRIERTRRLVLPDHFGQNA